MLGIVATGVKHGPLGKKREQLIENTIQICLDELKLNRFHGIIHVKQTRTRKYMDGWAVGYATMDRVEIDKGNIWWGIIEIANQHPKDIVKTLCHEMVHIKQYLRKELSMNGLIWMGKDTSNTPYMEQPAEKEAYKLQEELYQKCVDLKVI